MAPTVASLYRIPRVSLLSDDDLLESLELSYWQWEDVTVEELERKNLQRTALRVQKWEAVSEFLKHCTTFPTALRLDCDEMSPVEVEMIIETLPKVVAQNSAAAAAFHLLILFNLSRSESGAVVAKYLLHPTTQTHLRHLSLKYCSEEAWAHMEPTLRNPQCPITALSLFFKGRRGGFGIADVQRMPNLTAFCSDYYGDHESPELGLGNLGRLSKLLLRVHGLQQLPAPLLDALESPQCQLHTLYLIKKSTGGEEVSISSSVLRLAQALQSPHNSVRELGVRDFPMLSLSEVVVHLHKALQSPHCKIQALHLEPRKTTAFGEEETKLIAEMLQSHLLGLELAYVELSGAAMYRLSQALRKSKLHTLILRNCRMTDEAVSFLADALRRNENPNFTLDLQRTRLPSREAKMLLIEALETNFHLTKLDHVNWEDGGLEARCAVLMEQNERMQKAALLQQKFGPPKTGRLFICGNQEVRKTTLRRGLSKVCSNINPCLQPVRSCSPLLLPCSTEARTRGIELETLQFQGGKQLVVHDLAGQNEYHSFHHFFVSGATQDLFIIVCKFDRDQTKVEGQLNYWLKFICSHCSSPASSNNLLKPKVLLVLNFFPPHHRRNDMEYMQHTAHDRTQTLKDEFEAMLNFEPEIFGVNARIASHSIPIARKIESLLDQFLASREIPQLCNEIASLIAEAPPRTCSCPFQKRRNIKSIFRGYSEVVEEHQKMFPTPYPTSNEAYEAAMKELHQEGKIVYFHIKGEKQENQIVIANCGWFCKAFMGALFEPENMRTDVDRSNSGQAWVWRVEEVKDILRKQEQCEEEQLKKVIQYLENLELLYFMEQEKKQVLVPSLLSARDTCGWPSTSSSDEHVHFGRRLCCKDTYKTLLPSGVFSRLQVKLHTILGVRNQSFQVGDGWILFSENKVNVIVMHGGLEDKWEDRQWIDIMIRRSVEEDTEAVAEKIVKEIIGALFEIHSGTRALGGVELEEKVMSDRAVKDVDTTSSHAKSLSWIKSEFLNNGCRNQYITWSNHSTTPILQLLWGSEATKMFQQHVVTLKSLAKEHNVNVAEVGEEEEFEEATKEEESPSSIGSKIGTHEELYKALEKRFKALEKLIVTNTQWLDKRNEDRHRQMTDSLQKIERRILSSCSNQLVRDLFKESMPALPYLSNEVGHFQKLKQFMLPGGKFGRLHFLCESPHDHPHAIKGQEGVSITIPPEWLNSIAPFLVPVFQLLCCVTQLGINLYLPAFHPMFPSPENLTNVLGLGSKAIGDKVFHVALDKFLEKIKLQPLKSLQQKDLRRYLSEVLKGKEISMERDFSLYKVQFNPSTPGKQSVAWVCEKHANDGDCMILQSNNPFFG